MTSFFQFLSTLLSESMLKGINTKSHAHIDAVLDKVNLLEHYHNKIGTLSGGMVRRLGIAQAILGNPKIIVVDEPTAGLDPEERIRFRKLLRTLAQDTIVIISTHIVEDVESTCNNVALLYRGRLMKAGSVSDIANIANGKVWEIAVDHDEFYENSEKWNVVSSYSTDGKHILRILSETAPPNAKSVIPSLQEGYIYMMRNEHT